MLTTIRSSNQVWQSPDGKIKIYDFTGELTSGEQVAGQTRSDRIAQSINQVLDLTTTVSKSGKTYFVQVPKEGFEHAGQSYTPPAQPALPNVGITDEAATARFEMAVQAFSDAVDKLVHLIPQGTVHTHGPTGDTVATDVAENPLDRLRGAFGDGVTEDDLT